MYNLIYICVLSEFSIIDDVKEQLIKLSNDFETDEIMITSMSVDYEARRKSFELLANAFELKPLT
jgi:hypothetical protein